MHQADLSSPQARDQGMTLIELLVAMGLFAVVGSLVLGLGISTAKVTDSASRAVDLNEESRVAMERLARDLRSASAVTKVYVQGGAFTGIQLHLAPPLAEASATASPTASPTGPLTADSDTLSDPAYLWKTGSPLTLFDGSVVGGPEEPILAAKVTDFRIDLWSSTWNPLPATPSAGTSWQELGAGAIPATAQWWTPAQLAEVDRVTVSMTVAVDGRQRSYSTDVYLRNANIQQVG